MAYKIESLVKDPSVKKALGRALSKDSKLSHDDVKKILKSTLDGDGVTLREFKDLKAILKNSKTLDHHSKDLITHFIHDHYRPVEKSGPNTKLTKNFKLREFKCKDGHQVPERYLKNATELAKNLQVLRDSFKKPMKINSAYRTPKHNKRIGGKSNSQHLYAKAADIEVEGKNPATVKKRILKLIKDGKMKQGGIGLYNTFVHYDIRGKKARWGK